MATGLRLLLILSKNKSVCLMVQYISVYKNKISKWNITWINKLFSLLIISSYRLFPNYRSSGVKMSTYFCRILHISVAKEIRKALVVGIKK